MEKLILFIMILGVGIISAVLLLSKTTQSPNASLDVNTNVASPSAQTTQQSADTNSDQTQPSSAPIGPQEVLAPKEAVITTSKGDITVEFFATEAAHTVNNFAQKAKSGFYNNLTFHRVEDWVVQGGDPMGNGTGGGKMPSEFNQEPFVIGSLGVARGQDPQISNDSQFFITKKDASWLNNQYTNFGKVISGMDVVNNITIGDKITGVKLIN